MTTMDEVAHAAAVGDVIRQVEQAFVAGEYGMLSDAVAHLQQLVNEPSTPRWEVQVQTSGFHRTVVVEQPTRALARLVALTDVVAADNLDIDDPTLKAEIVGRV